MPDEKPEQKSDPGLLALNAMKNAAWLVSSLIDVMLQFPSPHAASQDPPASANTQPKDVIVDVVLVSVTTVDVVGTRLAVRGGVELRNSVVVRMLVVEMVVLVVVVVGAAIEHPSGLQQHKRR